MYHLVVLLKIQIPWLPREVTCLWVNTYGIFSGFYVVSRDKQFSAFLFSLMRAKYVGSFIAPLISSLKHYMSL